MSGRYEVSPQLETTVLDHFCRLKCFRRSLTAAVAFGTSERYFGAMKVVYSLDFAREYEHRRDTELHIGIYATREEAEAVIVALRDKPGFSEHPAGFDIHEWRIGLTGWVEGFVTTYGSPPKDAASEAFDVPAWIDVKE